MHYLPSFLFAVLLCLSFSSCTQKQEVEKDKAPASIASEPEVFTVRASFTCEELRGADEPEPEAILYLLHNNTQLAVDTISTCSVIAREMYTTYNIPLQALSAAGGWWAGNGNFYYILREGDSLSVMQASRAQELDSLGYQYTLKSRFPITYLDE